MNAEVKISIEQWLQIRKDAAKAIDPETAEVMWDYGQILDPYDVYQDIAAEDEEFCVGRLNFARSPGSDVWVSFYDLPKEIHEKLFRKHRSKLEFPAGLIEK